ncbi:MAG: ABC transporter substrate-binding protein [Candidatus Paraimprobicoccus trichonymphae]|uniref:ABC transporter substrate-binding protein n=1 Tax=Candidatus Paraimprobicoccus trichonymphae TaxID=3033793 RepID=A0AA48HW25_9FIRM|nr:MAG: ABC transporter substrate-binding protein [Candidatus Paraimprobicoccus trichonymphae]
MRKFRLFLYLMLLLLSLFAIFYFYPKRNNKSLCKVKLNEVTRSVFYSPQYVAMKLGYFEEEGIDLEISAGGGSDKTMTSLVSNQSDIVLLGPETCIYVSKEDLENYPILFAQMTKRDGSFIIGREDTFFWENLNNKKIIAGRKGGLPEMTFRYTLKNKNINDAEIINNIQFDLMGSAFASEIGDYVNLFEPTASMLEYNNKGKILKSIGLENDEIPYTCYCCTKNYLNNNPDAIQKFTNSIYKGQNYVKNHSPDEILELVSSYFPDSDREILLKSIKNYSEVGVWKENPVLNKKSFDLLQDILINSGELDNKLDLSSILNTEFAKNSVQKFEGSKNE